MANLLLLKAAFVAAKWRWHLLLLERRIFIAHTQCQQPQQIVMSTLNLGLKGTTAKLSHMEPQLSQMSQSQTQDPFASQSSVHQLQAHHIEKYKQPPRMQ